MDRRGFTLLELLVSMTLATVVVVIMAMALRMGIRAWTHGKERNRQRLLQEQVINLMGEELASIPEARGSNLFYFHGDETAIWFTASHLPMGSGAGGTFLVFYSRSRGGRSLVYGQRLVNSRSDLRYPPPIHAARGELDELMGRGWELEILEPFPKIEFRFAAAKDLRLPPDEWQTQWKRNWDAPPEAVALRLGDGAADPWIVLYTKRGLIE